MNKAIGDWHIQAVDGFDGVLRDTDFVCALALLAAHGGGTVANLVLADDESDGLTEAQRIAVQEA